MRKRVAVTGIGCISCFGLGHSSFADALLCGSSGVVPISAFDTSECRSHAAASIRGFDPTAFIPPLKLRKIDAVGRLVLVCARLLLEDGNSRTDSGPRDDTGIALGTFTAGLDSIVEYLAGLTDHGPTGVPALLFSNTVSNAPASLCAIELGLRGPNLTFNQREASSLAAVVFSVGAIRDGRAAAMITGGADRLEETFFKVHDRFRALSPRRRSGRFAATDETARPFDRRRNGFVLGEGGFLIRVEDREAATARGSDIYGEILGVGATASQAAVNGWPDDPTGVVRAMRAALSDANLSTGEISAIFASANGSPEMDRIEAAAIDEVFSGRPVPVTSLKGAIGESGAAGAASLVAGLLALPRGVLVPTVGYDQSDGDCPVSVSGRPRSITGNTFLVNSVASGGTNYCLAVRAKDQVQ
jgi:3-oxoacyl-[acyl-carrier-protein] synthase II